MTSKSYSKSDAISWTLHAIKIMLGDESIRQEILMHYHPNLHKGNVKKLAKINNSVANATHIRTFDAFVEVSEDEDFQAAIEKKQKIIQDYLFEIVKLKGIVTFTATNIQRNADDYETHFQSYIVNNDAKTVWVIEPAYDAAVLETDEKQPHQGIYYAEITYDVVKPFFEEHAPDYEFCFVPLSHPAQISFDDVFCQSWSLMILNSQLYNAALTPYSIPKSQKDKYALLLTFYKRIFIDIPSLSSYLYSEYEGEIIENYGEKSALLKADPVKILLSMTSANMIA